MPSNVRNDHNVFFLFFSPSLILHKSAKVRNERTTTATEYYVLVFFMQGQEIPSKDTL